MGISQEFNRMHNDGSSSSSFGPDGDFHDETEEGLLSMGMSMNLDNSRRQSVTLENTLAKNETRWVRILRCLVLLVLVTAAVVASVMVYLYVSHSEQDDFDQEFFDLATRLVDGFHANAKLRVQVMDMLAVSFTSYAIESNQTWPFVVIPDFEARCTAARVITSSDYLGLYPYVTMETREEWENFTMNNMEWLNESFAYQEEFKLEHNRTVGARAPDRRQLAFENYIDDGDTSRLLEQEEEEEYEAINATFDGTDGISPTMYVYGTPDDEFLFVVDQSDGPYYPMYQVSPAREWTAIDVNYNINDPFYSASFVDALHLVQSNGVAVFAGVWNVDDDGYIDENDDYDFREVPAAGLFYPVFDKVIGADKQVVGIIELDMEFGPLLSASLPRGASPMLAVVSNPCGQVYSYEVHGEVATYLGPEDLHDEEYNDKMLSTRMSDFLLTGLEYNGADIEKEFCQWTVDVYATQAMQDEFLTNRPVVYMLVVLGIFLFTFIIFAVYDVIVERRQKKVMGSAVNTDQIVASLFPKEFRDRLYQEKMEQSKQDKKSSKVMTDRKSAFQAESVKEFLSSEEFDNNNRGGGRDSIGSSPPLAELYKDCSVFFADIQGFTAWSSARAPTQVFTLLETLYGAFDKIARKYKVCKIETIGDCYVAITGCPEPQKDHALKMVCFARDCLARFEKLTHRMGMTLGPDTRDLAMRVGIHSGPVTAGILRGEKARFQLFGDTVNTASRMESNGHAMKIHCSQETAICLTDLGKSSWVRPREDKIVAKGKGELQTYWITPRSSAFSVPGSSSGDSSSAGTDTDEDDIEFAISQMPGEENVKKEWSDANSSWVGWLIGLFRDDLKQIVAERMSDSDGVEDCWLETDAMNLAQRNVDWYSGLCGNLLQHQEKARPSTTDLPHRVDDQLVKFVSSVAFTYPASGFHSFQRTCQSIMQMETLLNQLEKQFDFTAQTKFVVMFSILIRDLAHNDAATSSLKQVSNHHSSVEIALNLLMEDGYEDLRQCLCVSKSDLHQFWKLTLNLQLATEKFDKQLSSERTRRWDDAMMDSASTTGVSAGEKAAAVLEQLMMVAQEAHFMQHWDNYIKWSKLCFEELNEAFAKGLVEHDPSSYWFEYELENFDDFIIPLAQRIDRSGVLSAIGQELYTYARQNRKELYSAGTDIFLAKGVDESGEDRENILKLGVDPNEGTGEWKGEWDDDSWI